MAAEPVRLARPGVGEGARSEILAAAAVEFMERGYASASIDAIADRLGATKGLVYHYYRSKADLYLDVLREATEVAMAAVGAAAAAEDEPVARLRAMAEAHVRVIVEHFALQRVSAQGLVPAANVTVPGGFDHVIALRDRYERLFVDAIAEGVERGALRDVEPRRAVKPFLGALNWTVFWYHPVPSDDRTRLAAELAEFAVRGLLAT